MTYKHIEEQIERLQQEVDCVSRSPYAWMLVIKAQKAADTMQALLDENRAIRAALEDAATRMERARKILAKDDSEWNMLNTDAQRAVLDRQWQPHIRNAQDTMQALLDVVRAAKHSSSICVTCDGNLIDCDCGLIKALAALDKLKAE